MSTAFTDTERAILRIVQFQLPDTLTPYADIAREVGTDEETVLNLLRRMKEDGSITAQEKKEAQFPVVMKPCSPGISGSTTSLSIMDHGDLLLQTIIFGKQSIQA